jgi:hypothetical protein
VSAQGAPQVYLCEFGIGVETAVIGGQIVETFRAKAPHTKSSAPTNARWRVFLTSWVSRVAKRFCALPGQ